MRKIALLFSTLIIFLFASLFLFHPNKAVAAIDDPKGLSAVASCEGTKSIVTYRWDTTGYSEPYTNWTWDIIINNGPKIPVNDPSPKPKGDMPFIADVSNHAAGRTYNWRIVNGDRTCGSFLDDCEGSTDGPQVTRKSCGSDPVPDSEKCYSCKQLTINGVVYDGAVIPNYSQCHPQYKVYPGGENCDEDVFVGNYVCQYEPEDGNPNRTKYITLAAVPSTNGGRCATGKTCSPVQGCVDPDTPEETQCISRNDLCRSQSDCKGGGDNKCTNYWCVNTLTNKLLSDEDLNTDLNVLKCKRSDTKPACPEGADCDNPFGEEREFECTYNADDPEEINPDCFSGKCNPDGTCAQGVTAIACAPTRVKNASGDVIKTNFECNTALGKFSTNPEDFAQSVLRLLLGIAGGILLLLIILNGYKLMTSQGDPEKIKDAREGITAAIAGILLIIFSLALLRLITVDILGIPGFS